MGGISGEFEPVAREVVGWWGCGGSPLTTRTCREASVMISAGEKL